MLILLAVETFVVLIILGLGIEALKSNKKLNDLVEREERATMINQYTILILCTILRFISDVYFIVYNIRVFGDLQSCELNNESRPV